MSYPPYQGGYPNPPKNLGDNNIGFTTNYQQEHGQSMYPDYGGGFPMPESIPINSNSQNNQNLPYSIFASSQQTQEVPPSYANSSTFQTGTNFAPYPPAGGTAFFNPSNAMVPISYLQYDTRPPFPPSAMDSYSYSSSGIGISPYPPTTVGSPYTTSSVNSASYPPSGQTTSYLSQSNINSNLYASSLNTPYSNSSANSQQSTFASPMTSVYGSLPHDSPGCMHPYQERPTLRPAVTFDPSNDAALLRKAMKGFGTDEAAIIQVLGRRTSHQRQQIIQKYQQSFGKNLEKDLKSELSGQFWTVVKALMTPFTVYLAMELNDATAGIGTNERTLIEILCTNDNNTLRNIKAEYHKLYGRPLETDLRGDTSGDFRRLMVSLAAASREEKAGNPSMAHQLAQSLYKAGVKKIGTDESEFNRILSTYSYPLLRSVFQEYQKVSGGKSFESALRSELSGDFREGMMALHECIVNRATFYAHLLRNSMKGMGTNDRTLIRIIVSRCEIDMGNIKDEYRKQYGKRLEDDISSDTSGDYKKMLLALIQG